VEPPAEPDDSENRDAAYSGTALHRTVVRAAKLTESLEAAKI